jgi:excisionase family DNA binding protein
MNDILTAAEAAEYLRFSVPWVRSLAAAGKLPGVQIGDDWRFMRGQLYQYLCDQADSQQRKRQGDHAVVQIAQPAQPGKRGRPVKVDVGMMVEKYGNDRQ